MPKLTNEERVQRRKKLQSDAMAAVAARGQFNFRLNGKEIRRLYQLASKRQKPVSAMVREWVLERLEIEETNKHLTPAWAQELEQRLAHTEAFVLMALSSTHGKYNKEIKSKLRDHIKQHWNIEETKELHALF